jgi:hypothetical protein
MLMPVKCPSCNLLFGTRNELDWHVREEHLRSPLPARTSPADDVSAPADRTAPTGPLARVRRLLRPSGSSRQPASLGEPQDHDEQR